MSIEIKAFCSKVPSEGYSLSPDQNNSDLGFLASKKVLEESGLNAKELNFIIYCTLTPDYIMPSTACILSDRLEAGTTAAIDITQGGSALVQAFQLARSFFENHYAEKILVVSGDALTRITENGKACGENRILFGDGAGAFLLEPGKLKKFSALSGTVPKTLHELWVPAGGAAAPMTPEEVESKKNFLSFFQDRFTDKVLSEVARSAQQLIEQNGAPDWYIPPVMGGEFEKKLLERLKIDQAKVVSSSNSQVGYLSYSIPYGFHLLSQTGKLKRGDKILMSCVGAGISYGSCYVEY